MDLYTTKDNELSIVEATKPGYYYFIAREFDGDWEQGIALAALTINELKEIHKKLGQYIQEMEK